MAAKTATKRIASKGSGTATLPKKRVSKKAAVVPTPTTKRPRATKTAAKVPGNGKTMNPKTGFVKGSDSDTIATELLKGGASRAEIVSRLRPMLGSETRNGTPKPVANLVAGTLARLRENGFVEKSTYKVVKSA